MIVDAKSTLEHQNLPSTFIRNFSSSPTASILEEEEFKKHSKLHNEDDSIKALEKNHYEREEKDLPIVCDVDQSIPYESLKSNQIKSSSETDSIEKYSSTILDHNGSKIYSELSDSSSSTDKVLAKHSNPLASTIASPSSTSSSSTGMNLISNYVRIISLPFFSSESFT